MTELNLDRVTLADIYEDKPEVTPTIETVEAEAKGTPETEKVEDTEVKDVVTPEKKESKEKEVVAEVADPEEEVKETENNEVSIFKNLNELTGYEVEGEFDETVEGIANYSRALGERIAEEQLGEVFNQYPEVQELLDYMLLGGEASKFLQTKNPEINYSTLDVEDEEVQKAVVRTHLKNQDYSDEEIAAKIDKYDAGGVLEDEAKDAIKRLQKDQDRAKENLMKEQQAAAEARKTEVVNYWKGMQDTLFQAKELKGIPLTDRQKNELFTYMAKPVDKSGRSKEMVDDEKISAEDRLAIAFLKMNKFDFKSFITNKATTLNAESTIRKIKAAGEKVSSISDGREPVSVTKIKNITFDDILRGTK